MICWRPLENKDFQKKPFRNFALASTSALPLSSKFSKAQCHPAHKRMSHAGQPSPCPAGVSAAAYTRERLIWGCFIVSHAARMASNAGNDEIILLFSAREYKRERLRLRARQ
jgi:hypothetical protein